MPHSASVTDTAENLFTPIPRSIGTHPEALVNPTVRWWEGQEYQELERAVEELFDNPSATTDTFWVTELSYVLDDGAAGQAAEQEWETQEVRYAGHHGVDPTPTGELVRPYVADETGADPWGGADRWTDMDSVPPPTPVDGVGHAARRRPTSDARTPSRRELRQRERAANSPRAIAARRLAKGGVLVVTAFGVVAVAAPQVVPNLSAPDTGSIAFGTLADGAMAGAAAATAGPQGETVVADKSQVNNTVAGLLAARLAKESAQAQMVGQAGQGAGLVAIQMANAQAKADADLKATRDQEMARAVRDAQRDPRSLAALMVADRGWSSAQFSCLDQLYQRESGWNYRAYNPSSGAGGIPQALPASKMSSAGSDWQTNPATQISWGLDYITARYGTPCAAWSHSQNTYPHWY